MKIIFKKESNNVCTTVWLILFSKFLPPVIQRYIQYKLFVLLIYKLQFSINQLKLILFF